MRMNLITLVFLFLSIDTIVNAGIISKFIRQAQPSVEMPLETFPSPAGHNAPEQVLFFFHHIL